MRIAIDVETEPFDNDKRKFAYNVAPLVIPYSLDGTSAETILDVENTEILEDLSNLVSGCEKVIFHNSKFDIPKLELLNIQIKNESIEDTMIMSALLHGRGQNGLKRLARKYLQMEMNDFDAEICNDLEKMKSYAGNDVIATYNLYDILNAQLEKEKLTELYRNLELKLIPAFIELELNGILIDAITIKSMGKQLLISSEISLAAIQNELGLTFNPSSTTQLRNFLYVGLSLIPYRYTKHLQPSVEIEVLEKFYTQTSNPILLEIINYLKCTKSFNNQFKPIAKRVDLNDYRLRCEYNQIGTDTGRTSAKNPNLQGIPKEGELRNCFIASKGYQLVCADFSQQEPRILAALSGDPKLISIVESNLDLYKEIASEVFNKSASDISDSERKTAKTLTLACLYGQQEKGVADKLGMSTFAAKKVLKKFNKSFPGVTEWKNSILIFLYLNDFVITPLGRRRRFDFKDADSKRISKIEREAINAVIQGTAADVSKFALLKIFNLKKSSWKLLAFVHDEFLIEVPECDVPEAEQFLTSCMSQHLPWLNVNFVAEVGSGDSWGEAKKASRILSGAP